MLVVSVTAKQHMQKALSFAIDGIELRLDYFTKIDIEEIKKLRQACPVPIIFTLRKKSQGGFYKKSEKDRLKLIKQLIAINPDYFDLEYDVPHSFIKEIHQQYPHAKLICSYHNFKQTPKNLSKILKSMQKKEFSMYKIATKANSTLDALRMLNTIRGICMGDLGVLTRILAPIVNSKLNYASLNAKQETAPGQLDLRTLFDVYHYDKINRNTSIYALLGDPVDKSQSHIFHNQKIQEYKQNAVYIKLKLSALELKEFFQVIKKLPFKGFSVTMPLKEVVVPFMDKLSSDVKHIQAVNTILIKNNKLIGFNTDSIGALNAIAEKTTVKNKTIVIVGAGGTAKAIAYEALKRGATVIILNRTAKRAKDLAQQLGCLGYDLNYADKIAKQGYDILVNATSLGMAGQKQELPIPKPAILPKSIVLDMVSKPKDTLFIKAAQSKNCICIYGEEVFIKQAIEQQRIWYGDSHDFPIFSSIKPHRVLPQLEKILAENRAAIKKLLAQQEPFTWENLMQPLDDLGERLHIMWGVVSHLNNVVHSAQLQHAYNKGLPKLSAYCTEISHNVKLYEAVQKLYASKEYKKFAVAQKKIISNDLRDFKLAGVALSVKKKQEFAKLSKQLAELSSKFSENLLHATHGWTKHIKDKNLLSGIPEHALKIARQTAKQKKRTGWLFTLEQPSYVAVLTYADNRKLREQMYTAYVTRASDQGPQAGRWDNSRVMDDILKNRTKLTRLLDFNNYAEYSLVPKMAQNTKQVLNFLQKLARLSKPKAKQEYKELQTFAKTKLQPWDIAYYSEKLRQQKYNISQEDLRPYFPEQQVLTGMFQLVKRLYSITIEKFNAPDVWHKDVKVFAVFNNNKKLLSYFYLDLYARPNKQGGAWMNDYRSRRKLKNGKIQTPIAYIITNFSPPIGKTSALFTHDEVRTLFHEFGHSLQHMLTTVDYADVSGINGVPWDAVELPSQFMENWCQEKQILKLISQHYKSKKTLPKKIFDRMMRAKNFQSGLQMLRQIELALFDFRLHIEFNPKQKNQIQNILNAVRAKIAIIPTAPFNRFQHGFAHIFGGGYAAGYYSYKWAEVLASDAFAKFEEDGLFNKKTAAAFLTNILAMGGSIDPMQLFKQFRGRAPKIDALLKHSGIT